jgi:enoyl-CoA hydratase/carnithine racemase
MWRGHSCPREIESVDAAARIHDSRFSIFPRMPPPQNRFLKTESIGRQTILLLSSPDNTNRLTRDCVLALTKEICILANNMRPLVIAGNHKFFSVGADLNEIAVLSGPQAYEFSQLGQALMNAMTNFPAPVIAAIQGHCMGGGFDLALACHRRIAAPSAVFGHRGAALGLITGWGGTQRLPRLIGKAKALELFIAAEKVTAQRALEIGLVDSIADDPTAEALNYLLQSASQSAHSE